jgi:hypothetical protein
MCYSEEIFDKLVVFFLPSNAKYSGRDQAQQCHFFFTEMRENVTTLATTFSYHWKSMECSVWTENVIFSGTNAPRPM